MEAVVSVSHGALGPLLGKLNELASEYARLKGVRRKIHSLRWELANIHAALQKYATLEDPDIQVKTWTAEVRELAYDIEDCIDKFLLDVGSSNGQHAANSIKKFFRKSVHSLKTLGSKHGIASQIEELNARLILVKDHKDSYKLDDLVLGGSSNRAFFDHRLSALFAEEAHLVGIDGPRDELIKWMDMESKLTKCRKVLSIVGFGGLGKTTLANEVYRKIKSQFQRGAFISVSQKPDMKKILEDIISQIYKKDDFAIDIDTWEESIIIAKLCDESKIIAKLREQLLDKRYLVVIDDIWSTSAWNAIKCVFPENNCSSRIIATTRIFEVARSCYSNSADRIYEMKPLSGILSRGLFCKRIFGKEDGCPDFLEEVSNDILKKCGGLPLAIISISSLLANKLPVKEEWEKVKRSIGFALDKNKNLEGMKSILSLSYNDLPYYLKTCLLYLGMFPEDHVIERDMIVSLWTAEGFISEERGQNLQDVAESYFYELINKSMVQPVDIGYDGKARACRVHDMMLELIISKAIEENFITLFDGQAVKQVGHIRRLAVHPSRDNKVEGLLANTDVRHVRSLICFGTPINLCPALAQFEALRVLEFFRSYLESQKCGLETIGKLLQLKYLRLIGGISSIPAQIVKLENLETLDLRYTNVDELPTGFCHLKNLLRLFGNNWLKMPYGIGNMRKLLVLSGIDISSSSARAVEELGELTSLRELDIRLPSPNDEMLLPALCKLSSCKLQSLHIKGGSSLEFIDSWSPLPLSLQSFTIATSYYFPKIPRWIKPVLTNLAYLDINLSELREEDLHAFGELPALLFIELWLEAGHKEHLKIQSTGFPSLKEFVLVCGSVDMTDGGAYVTFVKGAMPKLEKLKLPFHVLMAKSNGFYFSIEHLVCLKEVNASLYIKGAECSDIEAAKAVIRNEANAHLNHIRLDIIEIEVKEDKEKGHTDEVSDQQGGTDEN